LGIVILLIKKSGVQTSSNNLFRIRVKKKKKKKKAVNINFLVSNSAQEIFHIKE
jgi:hypothetical protein